MKYLAAFNTRLAARITAGVGTMTCAYVFAGIALIGLPAVLGSTLVPSRFAQIVLWVSSEFLQLVLLSILAVGQNLGSAKHDATAESLADLHDKHDALIASHGHLNRRIGALLALDPEHHEPDGTA
jgi:hypothetical protein